VGSRCLDLFAGTGALGLEAASRGASRVVLVEADARIARQLRQQVDALGATAVEVVQMPALVYLQGRPGPFDVVFLDPPFSRQMLPSVCDALQGHGVLASGARIYLETELEQSLAMPPDWQVLRHSRIGQVRHYLAAAPP